MIIKPDCIDTLAWEALSAGFRENGTGKSIRIKYFEKHERNVKKITHMYHFFLVFSFLFNKRNWNKHNSHLY